LAPTILRHLGAGRPPAAMRGAEVRSDGRLRSGSLRSLMARLRVIGGRRLEALAFLLCGWAVLLLAAAGGRGPGGPRRRAWALRTGALAVLWAPVGALLGAALEPSAAVEFTAITLACLSLGALTDALLPWPRAPIAPALAGLGALVADALGPPQPRAGCCWCAWERRSRLSRCCPRAPRAGAPCSYCSARSPGWRRSPRSTSRRRTARATSRAASCMRAPRATCATCSSAATAPRG